MSGLKLALCCYHKVGESVLKQILSRNDIDDLAVFTHADVPRHLPDLKKIASEYGVYISTENISNAKLPFTPDIISSVYYRNIISPEVIRLVNNKIFNLHPSLLPSYRGCSSVPWAIINNENVTGITYHYIDAGIDTGRILLQSSIHIDDSETQEMLYEKCMIRGSQFWAAAFELVKAEFHGVEQLGNATFYKREVPYGGEIDSSWEGHKIDRFIRAMNYPPYPYATYKGKEVKSYNEYLSVLGVANKD